MTTYQMQGAQGGTIYYFRAQAINNHGTSSYSNVVTLLVRYILSTLDCDWHHYFLYM